MGSGSCATPLQLEPVGFTGHTTPPSSIIISECNIGVIPLKAASRMYVFRNPATTPKMTKLGIWVLVGVQGVNHPPHKDAS